LTGGIIVLDKPGGITSFRAVQLASRIIREKKCGHAGTLDPMATGVLPICAGRATKIAGYLTVQDKEYDVRFRFGAETDTGDVTGKPLRELPGATVAEAVVREAVSGLVGSWMQVPPAVSAIKVDGTRSYKLARRGEAVELAPRPVTVTESELLEWAPDGFRMRVACSKGFYVRSLSRDLGDRFGVPMAVASLRRTRCGPFSAADAVTLERLEAAVREGTAESLMIPIPKALAHLPCREIPAAAVDAVRQGRTPGPWLPGFEPGETGLALLVGENGDAVALVARDASGGWSIVRGM
jgi:tRNA pseudouridine55 synthase